MQIATVKLTIFLLTATLSFFAVESAEADKKETSAKLVSKDHYIDHISIEPVSYTHLTLPTIYSV